MTVSSKSPWAAYLNNNNDFIFVIKPYLNKNKRTFIRLLVFFLLQIILFKLISLRSKYTAMMSEIIAPVKSTITTNS